MFDKVYLIKSISVVTNYNSSSCYKNNEQVYFINNWTGIKSRQIWFYGNLAECLLAKVVLKYEHSLK